MGEIPPYSAGHRSNLFLGMRLFQVLVFKVAFVIYPHIDD